MAKPVVDISLVGSDILIRQLASFEPRIARKVVRQTLRKSVKRLKVHIVQHLSGYPVAPETGRYLTAMAGAQPKALPRKRHVIAQAIAMPTRAELGISPQEKGYYPFSLEYGYTREARAPVVVPPFAPIRRAVNDNTDAEHRLMGRDIGKGVEREARTWFKKVTAT